MTENQTQALGIGIATLIIIAVAAFIATRPSVFDKYTPPVNYDPPYHYGDKVRLIGFYKDCDAIIEEFSYPTEYNLRLACTDKNNVTSYFNKWMHYADIAEKIQ